MISSYGAHMGEEKLLSGWRGSGTIFFNRCNLRCQYCQNHTISQTDDGEPVESQDLAMIMLSLQSTGCHNINLVSPTHFVPQIIAGIWLAAQAGLHLPVVYNTGGYDSLDALELLDGIVDIYMPDMKYASHPTGLKYSKIRNYPQVNQAAVIEMHRRVGDLCLDADGLAYRGLLVRHLVLPNRLAGTAEIVKFLAENISKHTYLNLMDQYYTAFNANRFPRLNRRITSEEYDEAVDLALGAGLSRLDKPLQAKRFGL
jgi:putative pyruvate formate lyase activating enzyme